MVRGWGTVKVPDTDYPRQEIAPIDSIIGAHLIRSIPILHIVCTITIN
jgi:hypothetical protein